jgi:hypothetical protein
MELRWFTPKQAKKLLDYAGKLNLFGSDDESKLVLNFDPDDIQIPVGFKPHEDLIDKLELKLDELVKEREDETALQTESGKTEPDSGNEDLFMRIIARIAEDQELEKTDVISRINKRQRKIDLEIEVLALLVAQDFGVDVKELADEVETEMAKRVEEQF